MARKTYKRGIKKYTALIPKTMKAAKKLRRNTMRKMNCFFKNSSRRIKKLPKNINTSLSKTLQSLRKRRN